MSNRPTLRTVATLSGLAVPTVSRALKDAPDISAATKARVRQIAAEVGYVPDRAGVRLRTGKTNVIALALGTDRDVTDHSGRLIAAIARALRPTAYHLIVLPHDEAEDPMGPVRHAVEARAADALILNRIEAADPRIAYAAARNYPVVAYGRTAAVDHAFVDFDNAAFGRLAAEALLAAGRRSLALIAPPAGQTYGRAMIDGLRAGAGPDGCHIVTGAHSDDPADRIAAALVTELDRRPQIDGLLCPSTASALAALQVCDRRWRHLGADVDIVVKEAVPFLARLRPELLTVAEDLDQAGSLLAKAAIQAIETPDAPPIQHLMTPAPPIRGTRR